MLIRHPSFGRARCGPPEVGRLASAQAREYLALSAMADGLRPKHLILNGPPNLLTDNGSNFAFFSECALILLAKWSDFDSAIRRFESSRPSQRFVFVCSYLASDTFGSKLSFRTLIRPSFRTFVAGSFVSR
jgi:hypothetical protein